MKKLTFKEVMKLGQILREIKIKEYIKTLDIQEFKNTETSEFDKNVLAVDLIMYVVSNIDLAEQPIYELVSSYSDIPLEEVPNMDGDKMIETFTDMFTNGIPQIIKDLLKIENNKKKLKK